MLLINDVVWSEYLLPTERYLLERCFYARDALLRTADGEYLKSYIDMRGVYVYDPELDGELQALGQPLEDMIDKAIDSLGGISYLIKTTAENRYIREILNKCFERTPEPILLDIKKVLCGYHCIQDIHSSDFWRRNWKRATRKRAIQALSRDCEAQIEALQLWAAENTGIIPDEKIHLYVNKAPQLIEQYVDEKLLPQAKGGKT